MSTLFALATTFLFSSFAVSQISYPDCTETALDWTFNSLGQNPCQVAAYLQSTCSQGSFTVLPLPPGYEYSGPSSSGGDNYDLCKCSTVTYSLLCACDACQGSYWIPWSEWVYNCSMVLPPSTFPNPVPDGIYVPYWSTLDITLGNNWDPYNAMSAGDTPEIGPGQFIGGTGSSPTQTTAGTPTQTLPATGFPATTTLTPEPNGPGPTSSSLPLAASSSQSSSSKTGPIVGGAVGGVALIGIVTLVFVYLRRRRLAKSPHGVPSDTVLSPASPVTPPSMKLYVPGDPTTFPDLQAASYAPNIAPQVIFRGSSTMATQPSVPQYHGLPTGPARPLPLDLS